MPKKADKKPKVTRKQKLAAARSGSNNDGAGLLNSGSDITVERLENPVKPDTDKNEYRFKGSLTLAYRTGDLGFQNLWQSKLGLRPLEINNLSIVINDDTFVPSRVIRLPNGLTSVLISHNNAAITRTDYSREDDESDYEESGGEDCSKWYEKIIRKERVASEAACKLCINVGSFSEQSRVGGESRLVPSVIVKGSKKYPRDNAFSGFVSDHGGCRATSDNCERTSLYFHVPEKFLRKGIDRFSQCFVSPLMKRSTIMRKRKELEEEYRGSLEYPEYPNRKEHLFSGLAPCGHPCLKFGENYLENMCQAPDERVYKEVLQFRERHYSAHRMTVVIEARLPLDTLEEYAKEYFSRIPNNGLPPDDFSHFDYAECFDMTEFRKMYEMKDRYGIVDDKTIELTWVMPPRHRYYKSKPLQYISWILNHKGKGSLFSYLGEEKLCHNVYSQIGQEDFENNSVWCLFSISLTLSDEGNKNRKKVLDAVYSYISLMKREGPQKIIFDEIRNIAVANFRFTKHVRSSTPYQELCESMHIYSPSKFLTGNVLFFEYDPAAIKECMELLTPDRVNIIIFDKDFEEVENVIEASLDEDGPVYFEREYYTSSDIREDWIRNWKNAQPFPEFSLPEANPFVADDFSLISIPENYSQVPEKIYSNDFFEVWYKYDTKFRLPECHMCFCYLSPLPMASPENAAMVDMMISILKQVLFEELYPARAAKLHYDMDSFANRLEIRVDGFNQKLPLLMQTITKHIGTCSDLVTEEFFEIAKKNQLKEYYQIFSSPINLAEGVKVSILRDVSWTPLDKHTALLDVKFNQFQHLLKHFTDELFVKCLVQGNMSKADAIENAKKCTQLLNCQTPFNNLDHQFQFQVNEIARESRCCRIKNLVPTKHSCCVNNYYQFGKSSIEISVMIDLLIMIMNDHIVEEFRTLRKLIAGTCRAVKEDFAMLGYTLTIDNYPRSCENGDIAWGDEKIENFRKTFNKLFQVLSDEDWLGIKKILSKIKQRPFENLEDEVLRNWAEILSDEYIFDRRERELTALREFQIEDLRRGMLNLTTDDSSIRKISIQIAQDTEVEQDSTPMQDNENEKAESECTLPYRLKYSLDLEKKDDANDYYITDIDKYKRELKESRALKVRGSCEIEEIAKKITMLRPS